MSTQEINLKAIADAIRAKENSTDSILASDFATRIANIQTGVTLPVLTNPASASDILSGKQAIDKDGQTITGTSNAVVLPDLSTPASASDILSGKQAINASGQTITGTISSLSSQTITPGTSNKTIAAGNYLSGAQTIKGDANLASSNIKSGVSIFGVAGSLVSGMGYYKETQTYEASTGPFRYDCGFEPKAAFIFNNEIKSNNSSPSGYSYVCCMLFIYPTIDLGVYTFQNIDREYIKISCAPGITSFKDSYPFTFDSKGMSLSFVDNEIFNGDYTILLFK